MPLVDMPLQELKEYKGRNPRPADHDAYWARALAEMQATDPMVELVPHEMSAPYAECFDMFFTGVRSARIHAKYVRPVRPRGRHPAVLQFHGYSVHSGEWSEKLKWAALGFSVAALDCRGQGGLSEDTGGVKGTTLRGQIIRGLDDTPDNLLFRHIFLDTAELARIIMDMPDVDPDRVGATGGSQGGGLAIACAALEPRLRRAFPVFPFLSDYQRVWEMDLAAKAYEELAYYFRSFDPMHEREKEIFTTLGYIDVQHLAPRIAAETCMAVGLMDEICPPSSQFAAYNRMKCTKNLVIYPDFAHESLPGLDDRIYEYLAAL
ncbi:MAG TPA: acetylxylan esterase [Spirochaetia bacterium]|nr:acetylxylan esterase [Spirochaetia bacterium]